ncbi:hypothetical protein ABPG77_007650 [Micractinium sp. CCAP 211/92]
MVKGERPAADGHTETAPLLRLLAVGWLIGGFLTVALVATACALNLHRPWGAAGAALLAGLLLVPLRTPPPSWARRFLELSVAEMRAWFPISVVFEDEAAFQGPAGPFLIGYEPHSVLPLGMCVFLPAARRMPASLTNTIVAATSTVFLAPGMRHMAHWMGCRPASREVLRRALAGGSNVALTPGGVQECFYMSTEPEQEVAFLRSRTGFVRLAIEAGAPIVPVFAFGQTPHYRFWRPFIDWPRRLIPPGAMGSFVRRIGYVPLLAWGWLGTVVPHRVPMHVVVGKPIPVERNAAPNSKEVQRTLQRYIQELCRIFEQYKAAAGHPHATLTIV